MAALWWVAVFFIVAVVVGLICLVCVNRCSNNESNGAATPNRDPAPSARRIAATPDQPVVAVARAIENQHREFSFAELIKATGSFKTKIGSGTFGDVYKGRLEEDGNKWVAVKEMKNFADQTAQKGFITEVNNAGKIKHRNLVQLIGYCFEPRNQKLLIVFDFVNNGTLEDYLFSSSSSSTTRPPRAVLSWENRYKIAVGLAAGIEYLHFGCKQSMIHRDIKPANVMLEDDFNPQLGDFGLSRFTEHNQSMKSTKAGGTPGYIAPEIWGSAKATLASDVFSFGLVLLQTVTGKELQVEKEDLPLLSWVWMLNSKDRLLEAVDRRLVAGNYKGEEAKRLLRVGLRCCESSPTGRPTMKEVKLMLEGMSTPIKVKPLEGHYMDSLKAWERRTGTSHGLNGNYNYASTSASTSTNTFYTAASSGQHKTTTDTTLPPKVPPAPTSESSRTGNRTTSAQPVNGQKHNRGHYQPPKPPQKPAASTQLS